MLKMEYKKMQRRFKDLIKKGKICPICHEDNHINGECEAQQNKEEDFKYLSR
jgi:hypothetical protein